MQSQEDLLKLYKEYFYVSLTKAKNTKDFKKKAKALVDQIDFVLEKINKEDSSEMNADQYFFIYKLMLDLKIPKLTELCLFYIEKMVNAD